LFPWPDNGTTVRSCRKISADGLIPKKRSNPAFDFQQEDPTPDTPSSPQKSRPAAADARQRD
jgi:hypothetical protein